MSTPSTKGWAWCIEAAVMAGFLPRDAMAMTLPELMLVIRGYRLRMGEDIYGNRTMTRTSLDNLMQAYPDA